MIIVEFLNGEDSASALSKKVAKLLQAAISEKDRASLLVSGGRSPIPFFKKLSNENIEWEKSQLA